MNSVSSFVSRPVWTDYLSPESDRDKTEILIPYRTVSTSCNAFGKFKFNNPDIWFDITTTNPTAVVR
jgi:hypothetical protein